MGLTFIIFTLCAKDHTGHLVFERLYYHPSVTEQFILCLLFTIDIIVYSHVLQLSWPERPVSNISKTSRASTSSNIAVVLYPKNSHTVYKATKQKEIVKKQNINDHLAILDILFRNIDEEGQAYLTDNILEWKKVGLDQKQIHRKQILFILIFYWGMFITWIQSIGITVPGQVWSKKSLYKEAFKHLESLHSSRNRYFESKTKIK
jgi:hypothetical protein